MIAFRLQTFEPASGPGRPRQSEQDRRIQADREQAYRDGFLAGQAAATETHLDDQSRLTSEFVEAIGDARLTNEAARRHVTSSLVPMVETLCTALAPSLAEIGVVAEIGRLVGSALAAAPDARPCIRCAPELAARITELLADRGLDAVVDEAPELLPREAQVVWDQGYDHLDLDACIAEILACVAAYLHPSSESQTNDEYRFG